MIVSFGSAELAALCNSKEALSRRWGQKHATAIARRLCDLSAATADTVDHIPFCTFAVDGRDEVSITFGGSVVVRGVLHRGLAAGSGTTPNEDHILITSLDIHESDR
jgi:hypothetical protein